AEEVFAHELGHTLGLGHSTQSDSLMRATAHADGRGARLTADDRAGIAVLYGTGTGGTGTGGTGGGTTSNKPAAPTGLAAQAASSTEVRLTWTDNASNEQGFRVERKVGSGAFQEVMTVGANTTEARITGLTANTAYSFRVRARNGSGFSAYSNAASVTTPAGTVSGTFVAPSGLKALARSANEVLLTWQDRSTGETGFRVERQTAGGAFQEIGTVPANSVSALVTGLAPGTSYGFRVRAVRTGGTSDATGVVTVTTPQAAVGAGCSGGDALCLSGGRFRVEVDWRDRAGNTGRGQLAQRTDKTATAWFFDSGNVELIVKILDGQTVNGNFWVFAGALSDVEYWIKVTDLQTGRVQLYHNRAGDVRGFADTSAFPAASGSASPAVLGAREIRTLAAAPATVTPAATQVAAGTCGASGQALCLDGNRFQVEVRWKNQHDGGSTGVATAVPGTTNTGYFWFFDAENTELVVKVLDGTALNGKFWVFSGSLTDLEYWITVTDTATGKVRTYHNPPGNLAGVADTSAF
ncbi:MAG TPA: fibronectin type III domain-containing protein, partial [Thermoanaerobaculia bacterium]|nr:fibronectin type III domain-containing protein [Thermoanaerobaculia bacterium]